MMGVTAESSGGTDEPTLRSPVPPVPHASSTAHPRFIHISRGSQTAKKGPTLQREPLHGITAADIIDALSWADQLDTLLDFVADDVLVAHNAGFDMGVLRAAPEASGVAVPSLRVARSLRPAGRSW